VSKTSPNLLLVEGDEEKRVIPYFMDEHVVWGDRKDDWVVQIEKFDGVDSLLKPGVIEAAAKTPGLRAVGVMIDANDQFESRWDRIRQRCLRISPNIPAELPPEGLIHVTTSGLRIGVWIMPDNRSRGMLETFLCYLVKSDFQPLWTFARECCLKSKDHGARYIEAHGDKANIHTYLAWLDPPGRSLHVSVLARALDARLPLGEQFVRWFVDLFQIPRRPSPLP
jgi:Protein of unknown function (DUF3226)